MNKKKILARVFAVVLVLVMVLTLAVACGYNDNDIKKQLEDMQKEIEKLQTQLAEKQTAIDSLTQQLIGTNETIGDLEGIIEELNGDIIGLTARLHSLSNVTTAVSQTAKDGADLVVLHTNDMHGYMTQSDGELGITSVATLRSIYEAQGYKVLTLDAGDHAQGNPLVNLDKGAVAVDFLNQAGYNYSAIGNHEFDYGFDNLNRLASMAEYKYLSANILYAEGNEHGGTAGKPVFDPTAIVDIAGMKVGIIGLTTPETQTKANPLYSKGLKFVDNDDDGALNKLVQDYVNELKTAKCDFIIALGHLGTDSESAPNRSVDVLDGYAVSGGDPIAAVTGINLFIDGHSHTNEQEDNHNGATLVSTGTRIANVGAVSIKGKATTGHQLIDATSTANAMHYLSRLQQPQLYNIVKNTAAEIENQLKSTKIAHTKFVLNGERGYVDGVHGNRTGETNLGNFATDAMLWSANKYAGGKYTVAAAFTNGGGIRETIKVGEITMYELLSVFPFGNTLTVIDVTGADILADFEKATASIKVDGSSAVGSFPQVSAIEYEIDTAKVAGSRVTIKTIGGQPFNAATTYKIVTNDFVAVGGDGFDNMKNATSKIETGIGMDQALVDYTTDTTIFTEKENNLPVVPASLYGPATVGNRVVIKGATTPATTTTDTVANIVNLLNQVVLPEGYSYI